MTLPAVGGLRERFRPPVKKKANWKSVRARECGRVRTIDKDFPHHSKRLTIFIYSMSVILCTVAEVHEIDILFQVT